MASFIAFSEDDDWFTSNFIFRRFVKDVASTFGPNDEVSPELVQGSALQCIFLHWLSPDAARRLITAMRSVAQATLESSKSLDLTWRDGLDEQGQQMYLDAVQRLQQKLDEYAPRYRVEEHP